jgi:3-deoxy-7-phosphoheptulonate synthase
MLVVMQQGATEEQIEAVIDRMVEMGFDVHRSTGVIHTVLGGVGGKEDFDLDVFEVMEGVKEAHRIARPTSWPAAAFRPAARWSRSAMWNRRRRVVVMAGPCSVESRDQIERSAEIVAAGRRARDSRRRVQAAQLALQLSGLGEEGLQLLREAADRHGLLVVSEVMDQTQIPLVAQYADILQVGARNMQNFNLLRELGKQRKPVLLKRGISATIEELLLSAEYIMAGGNYDVILCERGIRTFETYTRNTMDISAIPVVKKLSHLPIVADPSHGTGRATRWCPWRAPRWPPAPTACWWKCIPIPDRALSDGAQSLRESATKGGSQATGRQFVRAGWGRLNAANADARAPLRIRPAWPFTATRLERAGQVAVIEVVTLTLPRCGCHPYRGECPFGSGVSAGTTSWR